MKQNHLSKFKRYIIHVYLLMLFYNTYYIFNDRFVKVISHIVSIACRYIKYNSFIIFLLIQKACE